MSTIIGDGRSIRGRGTTVLFSLIAHALVVWYEEPALRRTFGAEYEDYCARVGRARTVSPRIFS